MSQCEVARSDRLSSVHEDGLKKYAAIQDDMPLDVQHLQLLYRATLALHSSLDIDEVVEAVLRETQELLRADIVSAWLMDRTTGALVCRHCVGYPHERLLGLQVPKGTSLLGWAVEHAETVYVPDLTRDPRYDPLISNHGGIHPHSLIASPICAVRTRGAVVGAIVTVDDAIDAFSKADVALLDALARSAAIAIENAWLYSTAQKELEERRRTQQALRQSETHYRTLVETSPDGIVTIDPEGKITGVNPRTLTLMRYASRLDMLGKDFLRFVAPEERTAAYREFQRVLTGEAARDCVTTLLRSDGTAFAAECSGSLMTGIGEDPHGVVVFFRDITARKEAEAAQQRHTEELQLLNRIATRISQVSDVGFILRTALEESLSGLHLDAGWVMVTEQRTLPTLSSPPPILQQGMEAFATDANTEFADALCELQRQIYTEVARRQHPIVRSVEALKLDGHPIQIAATPLKASGVVMGTLALAGVRDGRLLTFTNADIQLLTNIGHQVAVAIENAQLSTAAAEVNVLRELDRLRRELVSNVSHNLKTPLGLIKLSCTTLLRRDVVFDETVKRELLESIDAQVNQLTAMIDRILEASRLEKGLAQLNRQPVDLAEVTQVVLTMLDSPLTHHNLVLDFEPPELVISADPQHVEDVLLNLLDNAIKYSPDGGDIIVQGRLQQGRALVRVIDHGIGIPEDDIPRVFERFYRGRNARDSRVSGVGLGLPVVRDIIAAHGGEIWIEPTPGGGTTVSFTMPLALEHWLSPEERASSLTHDTNPDQGQT